MEMDESEVWVRGLVSSLYWTLQSIDIVGFMYMCASLGKDPAIFIYLDSEFSVFNNCVSKLNSSFYSWRTKALHDDKCLV